jgi:hypothetical protein
LKEAIDPMDFKTRVSIIGTIMKRLGNRLPPEIASQPPERYADNYEELIRLYSLSLAKVTERLRSL